MLNNSDQCTSQFLTQRASKRGSLGRGSGLPIVTLSNSACREAPTSLVIGDLSEGRIAV